MSSTVKDSDSLTFNSESLAGACDAKSLQVHGLAPAALDAVWEGDDESFYYSNRNRLVTRFLVLSGCPHLHTITCTLSLHSSDSVYTWVYV